ncbi:J domain-containing protein [Halobaculum litoreum]|uniref:J domain-containing protein n=1 Tax=Halobaculum litoreum TaxID=3031998 RepID=A0ABD5XPC5_9EURY|nr:J domain-containing protein [Halobaculum sp. DT92]
MSLDWPAGWDRTPPRQRERNRSFRASLADTTKELAAEMDRLDADDWRASIGNQHTKSNGLPLHNASPDDPGFVLRWSMDGEQYAVACDASPRLRDNVRWVYKWIHETRMRGQRPVQTGDAEFAAARLPPGDEGAAPARVPAHEVLGVSADADDGAVRDAYRDLVTEVHPDTPDGSEDEFKRVKRAKEVMLGE